MKRQELTFEKLCNVIRESCCLDPEEQITPETQFQRDLGVTGDDGVSLLRDVEEAFGIEFSNRSFDLGPGEYLFDAEGFDVVGPLWRLITRKPEPQVRSFTVGQLYQSAMKEQARQAAHGIQPNQVR
jgi:acyl carrier protein